MARESRAGAAGSNIIPHDSQFLYGYPLVDRYSTGIHDPLLSSALFLTDGVTPAMFISNDLIWLGKESTRRIRDAVCSRIGIAQGQIMITATHTHSGPMTLDMISNEADKAVPKADSAYLRFVEESVVAAAENAFRSAEPAEAGLAIAEVEGVGTNRRDPEGPADPEAPVLLVRRTANGSPIACMIVYSMHPTVLHEDSRLVSADFPGMMRLYL
ncbi:MAG: neutral/alkaline non-lysosomal ceramidase N-terminal domain-containing protein [Acidobacteriota bacterium]